MKKIIMLIMTVVTLLVTLNGCFWVEPWHHHHHHRGGEHYDRR